MAKPVIPPTPGRIVWYSPSAADALTMAQLTTSPMAAMVVHPNSERDVNLVVWDHLGRQHGRPGVMLVQGDETPKGAPYASWMPFQLSEAAKREAADKPAVGAETTFGDDARGDPSHPEHRSFMTRLGLSSS